MFQKKQLSNRIAEHIRAEIFAGNYPTGKFLRLEEVAHDLGVSVTPVREAFMALTVEGFIQHAERRGFLVAALNMRDLEDLYALLAQVSGRLAERAASNITNKELSELKSVQAKMSQAAMDKNPYEVELANDEFHRIINRAADSSKLAWVLLSILKYVPKKSYATIHGMTNMLLEQHERILNAIENRNPAEAYASMYEHEKISMRAIVDHLERQGVFSNVND